MLQNILIGLVGAVALFLVVAATRPSAYHVARKVETAAKAEVLFAIASDVRKALAMFVNTDKMLGGDIDKSLVALKAVAETSWAAPGP